MELKKHLLARVSDADGTEWTATLEVEQGKEPTVLLERTGCARKDRYNLHQFLSIAPRVRPFSVAGGFVDDPVFTLPAAAGSEIGSQGIGRLLSGTDGHYEIRWVPNDPRVPF